MSKNPIIPVILSGGAGSRLWPVSRYLRPKQFLRILSDRSLFAETLRRVNGSRFADPAVICNEEHRFLVAEEFRQRSIDCSAIICEPIARNTAPAIAAVAEVLTEEDSDCLMLVLPSDHDIKDVSSFHSALEIAAAAAYNGFLVTFGIRPDHPETGYGYIEVGEEISTSKDSFKVQKFTEKPNQKTAAKYVDSGRHFWNSGMFLLSPAKYLEELARLQPEISAASKSSVNAAKREGMFVHLDEAAFSRAPSLSIDVAVMEKTNCAAVVPVDMGWSDVGAWPALYDVGDKDQDNNVVVGDVLLHEAKNSYIHSDNLLVAAVGIDDLVVVATDDAVLVSTKESAQDVRHIVAQLEAAKRHEHIRHRRVYRPWGSYLNLQEEARYLTKEIVVNPGAKLSLQYHHHRAEHWVVVEGQAIVTNGENILILEAGQSTYIPPGTTHRLENQGDTPLRLFEVQIGDYIGEDDIVRVEDDFGRD